jgi:hypothetical protein
MGFSSIGSTYSTVPTYSWSVEVVTHEFGHLLGSQHTHACVWNGNNTAIDGCYTTEGGCANPGIPSGGGTIMSYCHLTNTGINFTKGFGTQPGNIIRSKVTAAPAPLHRVVQTAYKTARKPALTVVDPAVRPAQRAALPTQVP